MNSRDAALPDANLKAPSEALSQSISAIDLELVTEGVDSKGGKKVSHAFQIGSIGILLPEGTISELVENLSICHIPNTNPMLYGIGSLRGSIVPVYDLQKLFGLGSTQHSYFLIIGSGENVIAVLLDKIPQQVNVGAYNQFNNLPPLPEALRPFAKSAYRDNGLWIDCNIFDFFKSLKPSISY